jgi:hypothetical protein
MMMLDDLKSLLSTEINPVLDLQGKYKPASILVVIYGKSPTVVMTEKPKHMKFHAGEISFPGGKLESDDSDLLETALRETRDCLKRNTRRDWSYHKSRPSYWAVKFCNYFKLWILNSAICFSCR